jgi:hypothetical protein
MNQIVPTEIPTFLPTEEALPLGRLFPCSKLRRPLTTTTLSRALRQQLCRGDLTVHGFRGTLLGYAVASGRGTICSAVEGPTGAGICSPSGWR